MIVKTLGLVKANLPPAPEACFHNFHAGKPSSGHIAQRSREVFPEETPGHHILLNGKTARQCRRNGVREDMDRASSRTFAGSTLRARRWPRYPRWTPPSREPTAGDRVQSHCCRLAASSQ